MFRKLSLLAIFTFLVVVSINYNSPVFSEPYDNILFGAAKVDITPPIGTPLAGYGRRHGRASKGVHDPLYARVIALEKENQTFFFVSVDVVLVDQNLRKSILKKTRKTLAVTDENLVLFATHTHSGSGAIGNRFWERMIGGKYHQKTFERTAELVSQAIIKANQMKTPVTVEWGQVAANALIENRMDSNINVPLFLKLIRFKSDSKVVGQFIFFAAHPTLFSAQNRHFSADFPGVVIELLEKENPNSVALLVNGAAGDLRPKGSDSDYPEKRVERYGEAVFALAKTIHFEPVFLNDAWSSKLEKVKLPKVKLRHSFLKVPSILGNWFLPRNTLFQTVQLGKFIFITIPGEVSSEIGYQIEERMRGKGFISFVIGYANDFVGYVIPERYYLDQKQYESRASFYGKHFDVFLQKTIERLTDNHHIPFEGVLEKENALPILYLKGSAYEIGYQHGHLMAKEIQDAKKKIYQYMNRKLIIPGISHLLVKIVLARAWKKMEPYVSYDELRELEGLADGSGLSLTDVKRLHAIPDLIESMCSNGIYFGAATKDGKLIHIRNLDWVREMGIAKQAAVMVYEPSGKIPYVNLGYYGFIGVLTGVNREEISVGEVGADSVDESLEGTPMPFLLKRVLSTAHSLDQAAEIITKSTRTSSFNYMFGDAKNNQAMAVETTHNHFRIFKDNDPVEEKSGYGFPMKCVLMRGDPAFDPEIRNLQTCSKGNPKKKGLESPMGSSAYEVRYKKQSELVREHYGQITPDIAIQIAKSIAPDSNLQSVVIQFPDFWIANATDKLSAAQTEYHHFNYEELEKTLKMRAEEMKRSKLKIGENQQTSVVAQGN